MRSFCLVISHICESALDAQSDGTFSPSSPRKVAREARRKEYCNQTRCVKATNVASFLGARLLQSRLCRDSSLKREPLGLVLIERWRSLMRSFSIHSVRDTSLSTYSPPQRTYPPSASRRNFSYSPILPLSAQYIRHASITSASRIPVVFPRRKWQVSRSRRKSRQIFAWTSS